MSRLIAPSSLAALALAVFAPLALHPASTLYSPHSDMLAEHLPAKVFLVYSWRQTGEIPLWCPSHFAGLPFVHDPQVGVFYPPYWVLFLFPEAPLGAVLSWIVVAHVILAAGAPTPMPAGRGCPSSPPG